MKHLLTLAFISTCLFSFGQSNMYWNTYSNINPAMSGFYYVQQASATYTDYYPALAENYIDVYANYDMRIARRHAVGINYSGYFSTVKSNKVLLNYNYQLPFTRRSKLSGGVGIGAGRQQMDQSYFSDSVKLPGPTNSFELNLGIAYQWRELIVGFSATNITPPKLDPLASIHSLGTGYNFHAQYKFQIATKFQLTPRVLYTHQNGFQRLQPNLTLSYDQRFHLGVSGTHRDNFGANVGWDIQNKFRVAYMYSFTASKLNNALSGGIHELTVGYTLKQGAKYNVAGTPNF